MPSSFLDLFSVKPSKLAEKSRSMRKKRSHASKSVVSESNEPEQSQDTSSKKSQRAESSVSTSSPTHTVSPPTNATGRALTHSERGVAAQEMAEPTEDTFPIVTSQTTQTTAGAGTALSVAHSTVPFSPPLRQTSVSTFGPPPAWSLTAIDPTLTVVPHSTAPGQSPTIESVMATDFVFNEASSTSVDGLPRLPSPLSVFASPQSSVLAPETLDVTSVSIIPMTSSASTAVATPAAITPHPGEHQVSATEVAFIGMGGGSGLAFFIGLAVLIRRGLRKRKEAHRDKPRSFWRRFFAPSSSADRMVPLSDLERRAEAAPAPSSLPNPSNFADPFAGTDAESPPPRPATLPKLCKNAVNNIKAAFEPEPLVPPSPGLRHGFNYAFCEWERKNAQKYERAHARFEAQKKAAAAVSGEIRSADEDLGLQDAGEGPSDMVEICLDEEVALDEQERLERRSREQREGWDAARRSLSPFPKPAPSMAHPRPPEAGRSTNSALDEELAEEKIEMDGEVERVREVV